MLLSDLNEQTSLGPTRYLALNGSAEHNILFHPQRVYTGNENVYKTKDHDLRTLSGGKFYILTQSFL